jgi:hypothetical protein
MSRKKAGEEFSRIMEDWHPHHCEMPDKRCEAVTVEHQPIPSAGLSLSGLQQHTRDTLIGMERGRQCKHCGRNMHSTTIRDLL